MPQNLWCIILALTALIGAVFSAAAAVAAASDSIPQPTEARLERRIVGELEKGRVAEAQVDAEAAVKQYPDRAVLRRRHAQVELCLALQRGEQFQQALEDAIWSQNLAHVVDWLHTSGVEARGKPVVDKGRVLAWNPPTAEQREALERFRVFASGPVVTSFQEKALRELADSQSLLDQRSQALSAAFDDLKTARRLSDAGAELELTDLWGQVLVLFWREEPPKLQRLGTARVAAVAKAIAPFDAIKPEDVLPAAAKLAKQQPGDPAALAGAADVISVVAGIMKKPDPLTANARRALDRAYLQNAARFDPLLNQANREADRQFYFQVRDAKDPDVLAAPATVALQLYNRALEHDPGYRLPYLRLRLYLLRLAFEPEAARPLLEEIRKKEPGNAVVPLEEARAALLLGGKPLEAIRYWQEAIRFPTFSRSYLVAVPAVLRSTLKFQSELREWIGEAWPGYEWLFNTLITMQHPQGMPGLTRAELQLYERLGEQVDLPGLRLRLAERLSQATDYADQEKGIRWLLDGLRDRARRAEKQQLPPDQQAAARKQLADVQRGFAAFPRLPGIACLTMQGLDFLTSDQSLPQDSWPHLYLFQPGYFMFGWDPRLGGEFHQAAE